MAFFEYYIVLYLEKATHLRGGETNFILEVNMSARVVKKGYLLSGYTKQGDPVRVKVRASIGKVPNGNMEWLYVVLADSQFAWIKGLPEGKGFLMQTLPLYGPEEDWSDQIQAYYAKLPKEDGFETSVPAGAEIELFGDSYYIIAG